MYSDFHEFFASNFRNINFTKKAVTRFSDDTKTDTFAIHTKYLMIVKSNN